MLLSKLAYSTLRRVNALQQIIERKPLLDRNRNFPVQHEAICLQLQKPFNHFRKIARERLAGLRLQFEFCAIAEDQATKAVPFGFVLPAMAVGDFVDEQRLHWWERRLEGQAHNSISSLKRPRV